MVLGTGRLFCVLCAEIWTFCVMIGSLQTSGHPTADRVILSHPPPPATSSSESATSNLFEGLSIFDPDKLKDEYVKSVLETSSEAEIDDIKLS